MRDKPIFILKIIGHTLLIALLSFLCLITYTGYAGGSLFGLIFLFFSGIISGIISLVFIIRSIIRKKFHIYSCLIILIFLSAFIGYRYDLYYSEKCIRELPLVYNEIVRFHDEFGYYPDDLSFIENKEININEIDYDFSHATGFSIEMGYRYMKGDSEVIFTRPAP